MDIKEFISEHNEEALLADGFDEAIIGVAYVSGKPLVCYDINKIIEVIMRDDDMKYEDAYQYFEFNILDAYMGENTPVYLVKPEVVDLDVLNTIT